MEGSAMIYDPNTTDWPVGALVIHDADAKEAYMLMRVVGRTRGGGYKTRYAVRDPRRPAAHARRTWINDKRSLHDPARFGIKIPEDVS